RRSSAACSRERCRRPRRSVVELRHEPLWRDDAVALLDPVAGNLERSPVERHRHPARLAEPVAGRPGAFDRERVLVRFDELHGDRAGVAADECEDLAAHLRNRVAPRPVLVRLRQRERKGKQLLGGAGHGGNRTGKDVGMEVRIGCSGWNYRSWKEPVYDGAPARRWLELYAERFDTVEVNATFYRLPTTKAVAGWVEQTPDGFVFAVKASRYLTHVKRLRELGSGLERFYERIEPLVRSRKLGPVLWQLPENFHRDDERLAGALERLPELLGACLSAGSPPVVREPGSSPTANPRPNRSSGARPVRAERRASVARPDARSRGSTRSGLPARSSAIPCPLDSAACRDS